MTKNYAGLAGAALLFAGALSPMLRLPLIGNWNYWDIEPVLASVVFALAALALFGSFSGRNRLVAFCGWGSLLVVLFTLAAVYFKVNDYFSIIPLRRLARIAANLVKYQWFGWILLIAGAGLLIIGGRSRVRA